MRSLLVLLVLLPVLAWSANDRVLVILGAQFNRGEFWTPYYALRAAGYRVDIAGVARGPVPVSDKGPQPTDPVANLTLDEANPDDYVGLLIPGGYSPGNLEKFPRTLEICTAFMKANKPVGAICHGPRLLMRAGLMKDRIGTCLNSVANELCDDWAAGAYGKYLDEPVVVDGNLVTSRYPNDSLPFAQELLARFEENDGLPMRRFIQCGLVISTAIQKNDKWDVQNLMPLWGHEVDWVASDADAKKLMERRGYDPRWYGLVVLPDSTLPVGPEVTKLLDGIRAAGNPLLVRNGVKVTTKGEVTALNGDMGTMLQTIVTLLARPDCGGFETVPYVSEAWGTGLPSLAAADRSCSAELVTGFDERVFFALDAALASRNVYLTPVANRDRVFGLAGYPVHTSQPFVPRGARTNRAYLPGGVTIVYKSDEQVKAEDLTAIAAAALTPPVTDHPTAAIALREGFDDYVFAATYAYLTWKGHKVAVVGPKKGELAGLNGVKADVGFTYADAIDLPKDAVIVAPGSIWPMKTEARQATQPAWIDEQDARDKARLAWITERYTGGARLLTFGFDSLAIGKQAAFKGLAFAASDQCVWSFGKDGGRYDNAPAVKTADRLISAKGAGAVAGAIRLFEGK